MKFKKLLSMCMVTSMLVSMTACGSKDNANKETSTEANDAKTEATQEPEKKDDNQAAQATEEAAKDYSEEMTFEVYDVAANYQGEQTGWFAKVLKDKFNIKLNIIAPQVAGDNVYQTRASAGNLGDIVILEGSDFADCVANGLVKDISDKIWNYQNLTGFKDQIDTYNSGIPSNDAKKTYGIPCQMVNTSPTSYSQDVIYSSPMLRWDLYEELGCPEIKDLNGLLDVLEEMMKKHPTNKDGDPAYALSLWPDWDGGDGMLGIANAIQLTTWYGEKGKGSLLLQPDDTFKEVTDKTAAYYKCLHFLNDAYRRGLVDPDSGTQDWNNAQAKMSAGSVYLMWYSWQVGFWNTAERLKNGNAFIFIPVEDQQYYCDSDTYYGSGRVFGVGSSVDDAKYERIMDFLDWYASPEGAMYQHDGLEGFNYEKRDDGRYYQINDNALMDNLPVPDEFGGGGYQDGNNAINQWIIDSSSMNPITGEQYATQYWSTYKEATLTDMKKAWQAKFDAEEPVDWMKKNNKLLISPNVSVTLPSDTTDISVIRNQCSETFNDYSWQMIFAEDDAKFDALWDEMTEQMNGYGFKDLVEFDKAKYAIELEAKKAAK